MKITHIALRRAMALLLVIAMAGILLPASAFAAAPEQEGTIDPAVVAAIQAASVQVAQAAGVGTGGAAAAQPQQPAEEPTEEPAEEPAIDTPEEPVPTGEVVIPTEADFEEYNNEGISILAPVQWNVETDNPAGVFVMSDEAAGLDVAMQNFGNDFPGLVVFPIFEASAQALVDSFATDGVITDISRVELEQDVPVLRIGFTGGNDEGEQKGGVIYIIASGSAAFGLLGGATIENWPELEPVIDKIAESILLDDDMVDLTVAGDEGLRFEDPEGDFSLTVPPGWYLSQIENEDIRMVIADPSINVVGAMVTAVDIEGDDPQLQEFIRAIAGDLSDDEAQTLAEEFVSAMDLGADEFAIDDSMTTILTGGGDAMGVIRLVGQSPIEDGPMMDMTIYSAIYADKVAAFIFFGTPDNVLAQEEAIVAVLDGMTFP